MTKHPASSFYNNVESSTIQEFALMVTKWHYNYAIKVIDGDVAFENAGQNLQLERTHG